LGEAIVSVLAQSYPRFEIIVVDDGSTDNTAEVARRYPGVRCVRQENRGLSGARNSGLARSEGEYVVFLDADDRLLPEALEVGVEQLGAHPQCAFVAGHCRPIAADGSLTMKWQQRRVEGDPYVELLRRCPIFVPAVMYRRSVFETVGGFGTSLKAAEDYDLYYRTARNFPIHCHNTLVAEIRRHGTNMTNDFALMLKSNLSALRSQRPYVKKNKIYKEAYEAGVRYWQDAYGFLLAREMLAHIREREWKRAVHSMLVLLRYHPRGIALLNERHMERHRLARQLLARKQELEDHERRFKELESAPELESTLVKEPQEVQQVRERIHWLERRIQNLDQQALIGRNGKAWRSLKRLGRVKPRRVRRFRRLVRRKLISRVKPRIRRLRKHAELVQLLGFTQSVHFVMRRLRGAQTIALRVPGVRTPLLCRTFGSDHRVLRGVFGRQHYEIALQDSPQLIIDGGANIGYTSIYFANKYPGALIIAVEPDPENCALFRKNCAAYPNIELIQGALWTSSTDLVIENPTAESWAFRVVEAPSSTNRSFKGFTVADILARSGKRHIDLLKLDIEGSEEQLFSSNYANWIGCVKNLMVEVHGQRCREIVLGATKDRGFSVFQSGQYVILEGEASQDRSEREDKGCPRSSS
jgi:FkbM family methyltransferase